MDQEDITTKQCTKCFQFFPNTEEYFYKSKSGLRRQCKSCLYSLAKIRKSNNSEHYKEKQKEYSKKWKENNKEKFDANNRENSRKNREDNPEYHIQYREDHREYFREKSRERREKYPEKFIEYREENRQNLREKGVLYYQENKEKYLLYYQENEEDIKIKRKAYRINNREVMADRNKTWRKNNPEKIRTNIAKRKARKLNLPASFSHNDAEFCHAYWGRCCSICGKENGFWYTICLDHYVPLASEFCPGTIPGNMIPMCHSKKGIPSTMEPCCNNSKGSKDPVLWLKDKLGSRKAKTKLQEIETFFAAAKAFAESHL